MNCLGTGKLIGLAHGNRAPCPHCHRPMAVNRDGRVRVHWAEVSLHVHLSHLEREVLLRAVDLVLACEMAWHPDRTDAAALRRTITKLRGRVERS